MSRKKRPEPIGAIIIPSRSGSRPTALYARKDGLGITACLDEPELFRVTHLRSGMAAGRAFAEYRDARGLMLRLARLGGWRRAKVDGDAMFMRRALTVTRRYWERLAAQVSE